MAVRECDICGGEMYALIARRMFECEWCGHREEPAEVFEDGIDPDEFDDIDEILEVELGSV